MRKVWQVMAVAVVSLGLGLVIAGCGSSNNGKAARMDGDKMDHGKMGSDKMGGDKMDHGKMGGDKMDHDKKDKM